MRPPQFTPADWLRAAQSWARALGLGPEEICTRLQCRVGGFGLPLAAAEAVCAELARTEAADTERRQATRAAEVATRIGRIAAGCPASIRAAYVAAMGTGMIILTPEDWVRSVSRAAGWTGAQSVQAAIWLGASTRDARAADPTWTPGESADNGGWRVED